MTKKLTLEKIKALVTSEEYFTSGTLTICALDLTNGAQVVGTSNVINPAGHDPDIGRTVARDNAIGKIWELEGYALKTRGGGDTETFRVTKPDVVRGDRQVTETVEAETFNIDRHDNLVFYQGGTVVALYGTNCWSGVRVVEE